ncbi:MAG: hypothetical protein MI867_05080 [Pseudomonadales bacterium]|nr:hypothetical protein [Pseudomonadales bacterium]
MVRKLTAALLGVGVFVPGLANALGLGEIKLNSHLSEPLDAEIELVQTRELTESEILPGLASPDDFRSAGVERFHHLTDMKFEVVVNNNGRSYIKVKSRKPIREPFVNFLVEVHWPAGRLLREYTLLLDPPNFSLAAPQPVQPAVTTTAAPTKVTVNNQPVQQQPAAVQAPVASQPAAPSAPQQSSGAGKTYGPTGSSDSLWSIARALRPADDVSIQQTMIAIQQLNPDAFINGNINLLKKGKILRGPSAEQAREYSAREAINLVNQQNRAWKERISSGRSAAETETAQIDTSGRAVDSFEEAVRSDDGRLRLVSAEDASETGSSSGQGGASEGATGGVLRERAELAEETADQYRLQNDDLKSKVNELEEQVGTGEKLLDLKDDQIAALQARLEKLEAELDAVRKQGAEAPATVEAVAPAEPEVVEPVVEAEPEVVAAVEPETTPESAAEDVSGESVDYNFQDETQAAAEAEAEAPDQPVEPEQAVQVEASPKQVVVEPPEQQVAQVPEKEPSLVEKILGNPLYMAIIGGGIAALAVIGLILGRRRGEKTDELDDALVEDFSLDVDDEPQDFDEALDETEIDHEQREETVAETADVLGEADIYIAYGRFPQAIEMLEKAAEAEPQRSDIRMKLLETSIEAQDQDTFMRHYQEVQELGDPDASARANALKEKFVGGDAVSDEAEDFDAGDDTLVMNTDLGTDEASDSSVDFGLPDAGDDTVLQAPTIEEAPESAEEIGADLDFNLDFETAESVDDAVDVSIEESTETLEEAPSADLDFNLDVDAELEDIGPTDVVEDAASMEIAEETDEGLQFDSDFSLDLEEEEAQAPEEVSFGEAEESLDFELAEEAEADAGAASDESLEFNLDLDAVDESAVELDESPADELDDDATLIAPSEEVAAPAEDVIGSMEAAKLADELDLDGDFNLEVDAEEAVADDGEFTIEVEEDDPSAEEEIEAAPQEVDQPSVEEAELDVASEAAPEMNLGVPPASAAANSEEELDFLSDADEASTKLDLARAYIDMGDREGAKDILDEVLIEGNDDQQGEAKELLARLD